jgi:transcriptional regulator with XRE-family HTH domain
MNEKQLLKNFGLNLKNLRKTKNLSQEELAHMCELDRTYISGIERGTRNLSLINIYKLSIALNISASQLLEFNSVEDLNE